MQDRSTSRFQGTCVLLLSKSGHGGPILRPFHRVGSAGPEIDPDIGTFMLRPDGPAPATTQTLTPSLLMRFGLGYAGINFSNATPQVTDYNAASITRPGRCQRLPEISRYTHHHFLPRHRRR